MIRQSLRSFISRVTTGGPEEDTRISLAGDLGQFSLTEVVQIVEMAQRTGVLDLEVDASARGRIWFSDGLICHAEFDEAIGETAVFSLFTRTRGRFRFLRGPAPPLISITRPTSAILLDAVRRLDEEQRYSTRRFTRPVG
jgi:hypothetical protein